MNSMLTRFKAIQKLHPGAEFVDRGGVLEWLSEGKPPTQAEIDQAAAEIEAEEAAPKPDWRGFLQVLRATTVFASLRGQARQNVAANALATELRTALGEAALGFVDEATVQGLLGELAPTLTLPQQTEIATAIAEFNIPLSLG